MPLWSRLSPALHTLPRVASLVLVATTLHAQNLTDRAGVMTPPPGTAATVDEAHALVINPAGLGFMEGPQLMVAHSGADFVGPTGASTSAWGGARLLGRLSLAGGADWLRPAQPLFNLPTLATQAGNAFPLLGRNAVRLNVGAAFRFTDELSLGIAYRHMLGTLPSTYNIGSVDVGMTLRPMRLLSFGLVLEQGNSPFVGNHRMLRSVRASVAFRPVLERLTVSYEFRVDEYLRLDHQLLGRAEVLPGVSLFANAFHNDVAAGSGRTAYAWVDRRQDTQEMWSDTRNGTWSSFKRVGVGAGVQVDLEHFGGGIMGSYSPGMGFLEPAGRIPDPRTGGYGTLGGLSVYGRASLERYPSILKSGSRFIMVKVQGDLGAPSPESPVEAVADLVMGASGPGDVVAQLDTATRDPRVKVVFLRIGGLSVGWGRIVELRKRVEALRKAGKRVVAYLDSGGDEEYHVAAAADRIYLAPGGMLGLDGFSVSIQFVGAALDRIGVHVQAVAAGKYKSAPEQLMLTEPTEPNKEVQRAILDGLYDVHTTALARLRNMPLEKVKDILDKGGISAQEALELRLVDGLAYVDDVGELAGRELGVGKMSFNESYGTDIMRHWRWAAPRGIAVVPIKGEIRMGRSGVGMQGGEAAGADDVVDALHAALEDDDIQAVVLRVESPGGDSLASDLIWNAVAQVRKKKPVIASFGDVAASGGYYAACGADLILAEPTTITGSIGVFALSVEAKDLLDRFGVNVWEESRGKISGGGWWRPWNQEERAAIERQVGITYGTFLKRVKDGRKFSQSRVEELAQGRVWTGTEAKERGLVDQLGGLVDAIELAKARVGLAGDDTIEVRLFTGKDDTVTRWGSALNVTADMFTGERSRRDQFRRAAALLFGDPQAMEHAELLTSGRHLALMPYTIRVR